MGKKRQQMQRRDHDWRDDRIADLEAENTKLSAQLATLQSYAAGGVQGVSELVHRLQAERDHLRSLVTDYEEVLPMKVMVGDQPLDEIDLPDNHAINTRDHLAVGITVFWRDGTHLRSFKGYSVFPGTSEEFLQEAIPQIALGIMRSITPSDIGKQSVMGVSTKLLVQVITELRRLWDGSEGSDRAAYIQRRGEIFDQLWPQIETETERLGISWERHQARDQFNKVCDNTLKYARRRLSRFKVVPDRATKFSADQEGDLGKIFS